MGQFGMAPGAELIAVSNPYAGGSWLIHSDSYQKDTMGTLAPHMIKAKSAHSRLATCCS